MLKIAGRSFLILMMMTATNPCYAEPNCPELVQAYKKEVELKDLLILKQESFTAKVIEQRDNLIKQSGPTLKDYIIMIGIGFALGVVAIEAAK